MLDCVMVDGSRGIDQLYGNLTFKNDLEERSALVIPSLLEGTVEVLPIKALKDSQKKKLKAEQQTHEMFRQLDYTDNQSRALEREKWRSWETVRRRVHMAYGTEEAESRKNQSNTRPANVIIGEVASHFRETRSGSKRKSRSGSLGLDGSKKDGSGGHHGSGRNVRRKRRGLDHP